MLNSNLFSMESQWFRYSDYEIVPYNEKYYDVMSIKAKSDATLEWYNPFDEYPYILKDFLEMLNNLDEIDKQIINGKLPREETIIVGTKKAEVILEFIKNYGFFGLIYIDTGIVTGQYHTGLRFRGVTESEYIYNHKPEEEVYEYISRVYFPDMDRPIPAPLIDKLPDNPVSKKYFSNYKEVINRIEGSYLFRNIHSHYKNWKKGEKGNIVVNDIGVGINTEGNLKLSWYYNDLLTALKIMYILNILGKMGENKVKICERKDCNNTFIVGPYGKRIGSKYCSSKCGNLVRVRRSRNKNS